MILTLRSLSGTVHIDITTDQFKRLRDSSITENEIRSIADTCSCDGELLLEYVVDLKRTIKETMEIDSSCDYTDHFS